MKINHPHDSLFGFTFNDKGSVIQFGKKFFPADIVEYLDFESFQKEDTSYITEQLQSFYSDKVWSCTWKGTEKPVKVSFLFEHKSYVENPWLQLLRYLLEGYRQQILQQQEANKSRKTKRPIKLTVIIPIIFYHGDGKWHYRSFEDQFDLPHPILKRYLPSFQYILTDLANYSDEELIAMEIGFLLSTLLLLKHKSDKDFLKQFHREIFIFVEHLPDNPSTDSFLEAMIIYISRTNIFEAMELKELIEQLPSKVKSKSMTTFDKLILEGKNIGIKEGKSIGIKEGKSIGIKEGEAIGAFKKGIQFVLVAIAKKSQFTSTEISEFSGIATPLIVQIRNSFKEKKLTKANQVILKAFQKITPLSKEERATMRKMVKKYYLQFNKKQEK